MDMEDKLALMPLQPGVYLMKNGEGTILYVGKAKNLRSRVRSYFRKSGDGRFRIQFLIPNVEDIEFLVTDTEKEALILENTLIKAHKPRFNVNLRDDKSYVNLRLDPRDKFPRLTVVRRPARDGRSTLDRMLPPTRCVRRCAHCRVSSRCDCAPIMSSTRARDRASTIRSIAARRPASQGMCQTTNTRRWWKKPLCSSRDAMRNC